MSADLINRLAGIFTVVSLVVLALCLFSFFLYRREKNPVIKFIERRGVVVVFSLSLLGLVGSLVYSLGVGYAPCDLCWYQRIFMYPLVFLFGFDLLKKRSAALPYGLLLSIVGFSIALYHTILQSSIGGSLPCPATGVSCAQRFVFEFGFVTIPLMSLTIFSLILMVLLVLYFNSRKRV
ncbi:disulfide bond formation protein B [Candidatus Parcubacteria bacterium]|nr:disulfide bond formation protein B [Candidatus Parcubacteria bacterium]